MNIEKAMAQLAPIAAELAQLKLALRSLPKEDLDRIQHELVPLKDALYMAGHDAYDIISWSHWFSTQRLAPQPPNPMKELLEAIASGKITPEMIAEAKAKAQEQK